MREISKKVSAVGFGKTEAINGSFAVMVEELI